MKKFYFIILSCAVLLIYACKPKFDIEKETEAIKALIQSETQAFIQNDTAKVLSYYIQDDYQTRLSVGWDTIELYKGWKELSTFFKNNPVQRSNPKSTKDFIQIKVIGDAAWAIYEDNWTYTFVQKVRTDAAGTTRDTILRELRNNLCTMNLEKKLNEWKISSLSIFQK
jgi:hypothetical protein